VSNKPVLPEPEYWLEGTDVANYSAADMQSILEQGIAYGREQMRDECIAVFSLTIEAQIAGVIENFKSTLKELP